MLRRFVQVLLCVAASACGPRGPDRLDEGTDVGAAEDVGDLGFSEDLGAAADLGLVADLGGVDANPGVSTGNILVRRVIDGDTIILSAGPELRAPDNQALDDTRVRLIGVDTPEIGRNGDSSDCFAEEALDFTQALVGGRLVELEYDFTGDLRDPFGRLLAYVRVQGVELNARLVEDGYARVFRQFTYRKKGAYLDLEAAAQRRDAGLWGACP